VLRFQAKVLHETGIELIARARKLSKVSEVEKAIKMGMNCLEESRKIVSELEFNSAFLFLDFIAAAEKRPTYELYLEFCARNDFEHVEREDFEMLLKGNVIKIPEK